MSINLLDCTLRDGGYVNDWNFGFQNIRRVVENLVKANVEYIEMGFLDSRASSTIEKSLMKDMHLANQILKDIDKKKSKVVAMIDFGTFPIENFIPKEESLLDGVRVFFRKEKRKEALEYCGEIRKLGYEVSANAIIISGYNDEEFLDLINLANKNKPTILTFVDTYGIFTNVEVEKLYKIMEKNLDEKVMIGFHSHNSIQLAYANTMLVASLAKKRDVVIDGTLYGMGKSAGNANTELLMHSLNKYFNKNYNISKVEGIIEDIILPNYNKKYWGYTTDFFIASDTKCHYNYIKYYHNEKNIGYDEIMKILDFVKEEDRFSFTKEKAELVLDNYFNEEKYILFDIDGTIFNTYEGILNSLDYTLSSLDYKPLTKKEKEEFIGPLLFTSFKNKYNLNNEELNKIVNIFRDYYKENEVLNYKIYDGIVNLLDELKKSNYKLAIATNKRQDLAELILKDAGIYNYFDVIKGTDYEGTYRKSEIINFIKKELKVKNNNIVMVGDTYSDYEAAKENNVSFIGVTYGFGFKEDDKDNKDLIFVSNVAELSEKLKRRTYED